MKSYLLRLGASAETAEEIAQEALLTVWRRAVAFDPGRAASSTWIFTIARNLRIDALRREGRRRSPRIRPTPRPRRRPRRRHGRPAGRGEDRPRRGDPLG